jgi:hypothetical protein
MKSLRLMGLLLLLPVMTLAADLSGQWQGSDGGDYYLVQQGSQLYWYAERSATAPVWAHVFDGHVRGDQIRGKWTDVPKGNTRGHGELELRIRQGGNVLIITHKTGGFGGDRLIRAGYAQAEPVKPPYTQINPSAGVAVPKPLSPVIKEDCIAFNWQTTTRQNVNGRWKIVDGNHWLFDFGDNAGEAAQALSIIRHYQLNSSCFVGRPDPSLSYLLSNGQSPSGAMSGEACVGFNPNNTNVVKVNGRWKVVDANHWLFDFGGNEGEARQALAIIKQHHFSQSCFVGRPDPSFTYMRR